ncbi:MAG: hypothetical protein II131_00450 [Neisseriaceae bacterium]|nr:hypothetical protein [Neisseriaceae bacterium]
MMIRKWFRLPENAKSNAYRRCWWVENPPYGVTVFVFQPEKKLEALSKNKSFCLIKAKRNNCSLFLAFSAKHSFKTHIKSIKMPIFI